MDAAEKKALSTKLNALVELKGVVAASKYEITPNAEFRLPRELATARSFLYQDFDWQVLNLCEISLAIAQAEAIDYDNATNTRHYFPPGAVFIRGHELSFLGTMNRVAVILRNAEQPDLWEIIARMQAI